jgi:hypothetical protein
MISSGEGCGVGVGAVGGSGKGQGIHKAYHIPVKKSVEAKDACVRRSGRTHLRIHGFCDHALRSTQ